MVGGTPNEFLNRIYSCQDTVYIYDGIKYWFQGYMPDDKSVHMEIIQYQPPSDKEIWCHDGKNIEECYQAFIDAPIFGGKTFWDAEQDVQWVDDQYISQKLESKSSKIKFQTCVVYVGVV